MHPHLDPAERAEVEALLAGIAAKRGGLADWQMLLAAEPGLLKAYVDLRRQTFEEGDAIPRKYKELFLVALGMARGAPAVVETHAREALEQGASRHELGEALRMGFLESGMPGLASGLGAVGILLEHEQAKAAAPAAAAGKGKAKKAKAGKGGKRKKAAT